MDDAEGLIGGLDDDCEPSITTTGPLLSWELSLLRFAAMAGVTVGRSPTTLSKPEPVEKMWKDVVSGVVESGLVDELDIVQPLLGKRATAETTI